MYQGGLSFGDGFKFGCGFYAASIVAGIVIAIVAVILTVVAGLLGMSTLPLLQNSLQNTM
jgi:hypothetical protein